MTFKAGVIDAPSPGPDSIAHILLNITVIALPHFLKFTCSQGFEGKLFLNVVRLYAYLPR